MPHRPPSRSELDRALSSAKHKERLLAASPKRDDIIKEFGRSAVTDHPDGSWSASIKHDKEKMLRAERMMRGVRKEQSERGEYIKAGIERERVKTRDGRVLDLYAHLADGQARKHGVRPMSRIHGPRDYYRIEAPNYEQGPDGLYFLWDGGWEPVNMWRNKAESPQRDPDGNVWVEVETDGKLSWLLKEEQDGADDGDGDSGLREISGAGPRDSASRL